MDTSRNILYSGEGAIEHNKMFRQAELTPVPKHLQDNANKALAGKKSRYISKKSKSALARWAANERLNKQSDMVRHCNQYYDNKDKLIQAAKRRKYFSSHFILPKHAEMLVRYAKSLNPKMIAEINESSSEKNKPFVYVILQGASKNELKKIRKFLKPFKPFWRVRFTLNMVEVDHDYRPMAPPIDFPYWKTAESDEDFILVACTKDIDQLKQHWPEAEIESVTPIEKIEYSDRFPKPDWIR